jgi:hypothetical protein
MAKRASTDVDVTVPEYSLDQIQGIESFEDAIAAATAVHGAEVNASDALGDGFALIKAEGKRNLVGRDTVLLEWKFRTDEEGTGNEFVVVRAVYKDNRNNVHRVIFTDGSTGICDQLRNFSRNTGRYGNLRVINGLVASDYTVTGDDGQKKGATTFYISTDE